MTSRELPSRAVLDELEVDGRAVRLVAWRDEGSVLWIGIDGEGPFTGGIGCHTGSFDDAAVWTSTSSPTATVLWGYVDPSVARCEIRRTDGGIVPARIVHLPAELSEVDRGVWGVITEPRGRAL